MVRKICDLNPATCTDLKLMKQTMDNLEEKVDKIIATLEWINTFILTSPQKFADKNEFTIFKDKINLKIAFISWVFTVVMTVGQFIISKYL